MLTDEMNPSRLAARVGRECHDERRSPAGTKLRGLIGVGCVALCFGAMPILAVLIPAASHGTGPGTKLSWGLLAFALGFYALGLRHSFNRHRRWAPLLLGALGSLLTLGSASHALPTWAGGVAVAFLLAGLLWSPGQERPQKLDGMPRPSDSKELDR